MKMSKFKFIPVTLGGSLCEWLSSKTEDAAWNKLLKDVKHMPYKTKLDLINRGYTVEMYDA